MFRNNEAAYYCYKAAGFEENGKAFDVGIDAFNEKWKVIELEIGREKYESLYRN